SAGLSDHGARAGHHARDHRLHAQAGCERDPRLPGRLRPTVNQAGQARREAEKTQRERKEEWSSPASDYCTQESLTNSERLPTTIDWIFTTLKTYPEIAIVL